MFNKKGFTLIELLTVVAIISLISSITLISVNSARSKARDSERYQHLVQIRNALELYFADNGTYPKTPLSLTLDPPTFPIESWSKLEDHLKDYIYPLPVDPINKDVHFASGWEKGSYFYTYWVLDDGAGYSIFATLENPASDNNFIDKTITRCNHSDLNCMYNEINGGFGFVNKK